MKSLSIYSGFTQFVFKKVIISAAVLSAGLSQYSVAAGISLGSTRLIYPQTEKQVSITVNNSDTKGSYLIQTWVSDAQGEKSAGFVVTPPLFVLKPGKMNVLRIMYVGPELPKDKETVFYLNNKAIPSVNKTAIAGNTLQIATQSVIKLFVRPARLAMKSADAPAMLRCKASNGSVIVTNPSPYFITLVNLTVGGKKLPNTMVPPQGEQTVTAAASAGAVSLQTVNDYGAITPAQTCNG
ncbi:fimbria/pilus periplasmic chaperone [Enterobacter ludwigii]|jgi:P pilus assembly chaperone PapD|nr:fimbria/pilus periplasmic chaperone [Enterobacter ludwigii]